MFRPTPATEGDSDSSLSTSFSTSFSSVSRIGAMLRNEQTTYAHYDYFGGKCKPEPQPQPNTARTRTRTRTATATATATTNTNTNTNANTNTNTNTNRSTAAIAINQSCRYLMARWCIRLCRFCECENVVATAAAVMSCVDRFVALTQQQQQLKQQQQQLKQQQQQLKQQQQQCQGMDTDADAAVVLAFLQRDPIRCYQLVVVTAWYTVTKIRQPFAVDPDSMERLSHGNCTRSDIERTEVELLATLGWAVHPPTPSEFAREFAGRLLLRRTITATTATTTTTTMAMATMATATTTATMATTTATATITKLTAEERVVRLLLELVDCQLEHVVSDYELSCLHRPSFVAFGALWNAMVGLGWAGDESHSHSDSDLDSDLDIDIDSADHANFNVNVNANASWKSLKERLLLPELGNSNGNGNGSDNDNDLDAELWRSVTSIRTLLGTVFALEESSGGISGGGSRDSSNRDSSNSFSSSDGGCHLVTRPLALLVERCCGSSNSSSNGCSNSNSNGCSPCSHDHQRNHQHNNHNHQHTMELSSSPAPKTSTRSELPPSPSVGGPFPSPRTVAR